MLFVDGLGEILFICIFVRARVSFGVLNAFYHFEQSKKLVETDPIEPVFGERKVEGLAVFDVIFSHFLHLFKVEERSISLLIEARELHDLVFNAYLREPFCFEDKVLELYYCEPGDDDE
mgnify:CR=1 FL=1